MEVKVRGGTQLARFSRKQGRFRRPKRAGEDTLLAEAIKIGGKITKGSLETKEPFAITQWVLSVGHFGRRKEHHHDLILLYLD